MLKRKKKQEEIVEEIDEESEEETEEEEEVPDLEQIQKENQTLKIQLAQTNFLEELRNETTFRYRLLEALDKISENLEKLNGSSES